MPEAPAPPKPPTSSPDGIGKGAGKVFSKNVGPLPAWAWIAAVAGGVGIIAYQRRNAEPAPADSLATGDQAEVGAGPGGWTYIPALPTASPEAATPIETNEQWAVAAARWLMLTKNYDPSLVDAAIRRYISGESLDVRQWSIISDALRHFGPLPNPLPPLEGNPPTQAPPPTGTKPPAPPPPKPKPRGNIRGYMKVGAWPAWNSTLWGIAKHYYGNGALWPKIYNANRHIISNPNLLRPGWILAIPR
jgi:LysM domain